jgi:hypothetical protein
MRLRLFMGPTVRGGFALLLCSAAFACDVHDLTAPTPAAVTGPRRAASGQGVPLGTASLAPPTNTSPAEIRNLGYYELGVALPESTWVMVHVSGGLNLVWNPACADMPPFWPCMDNSPTGSYGESPGFGGPVQLFNVSNGVSSAVRLRGSGGAGTSSASAVGIFYQRGPGPLVGHVSMTAVYAHNSINGGGTPSWLVTGGYTVTATQIEAPFTVTESAPEPDGTRTYTAEPVPGLRFSNFPTSGQFPPGAAFWSFYPDDSPPERNWPGWQVPGCQYQLVCRYKPPVPGRMQVNAFVEWQRAIVRSRPAPPVGCQSTEGGSESVRLDVTGGTCEQEPKLVLKCDGRTDAVSVTRGNRMECAAAAEPAGATLTDVRWQFKDEQGHTIPGPAGEPGWAGTMVVGGQVQVTVALGGKPASAALAVTVTPRDWTGKINFPAEPEPEWVSGAPLRYPPIIDGDTLADGTLGQASWAKPEPASGYGEGTGPNEGWFFFDQPPYFSPNLSRIWLNNALKPTDPFWRAQRGPPQNQVVMGKPMCGPDFMRQAARHVPAHEHGHYSRAEALAKSPEGAALLERSIHWGYPETDEEKDEMIKGWLAANHAQQAHWDAVSVLRVPCEFTRP